jgi:hypothetical protein
LSTSKNVSSSDADRCSSELGKVSLSDSARATEVVTKVIALGSALRKRLPRSVGINLNVVACNTGGASALLPRDSGITTIRSGRNDSRSRSGSYGVDTRSRPLASSAADSSNLEGDRVTTAGIVKSVAESVQGEAVGVNSICTSIVEVHVLVLSISRAVLELVSQAAVIRSIGSPVNVDTVSGRI